MITLELIFVRSLTPLRQIYQVRNISVWPNCWDHNLKQHCRLQRLEQPGLCEVRSQNQNENDQWLTLPCPALYFSYRPSQRSWALLQGSQPSLLREAKSIIPTRNQQMFILLLTQLQAYHRPGTVLILVEPWWTRRLNSKHHVFSQNNGASTNSDLSATRNKMKIQDSLEGGENLVGLGKLTFFIPLLITALFHTNRRSMGSPRSTSALR